MRRRSTQTETLVQFARMLAAVEVLISLLGFFKFALLGFFKLAWADMAAVL
jgi:hypothetical protein